MRKVLVLSLTAVLAASSVGLAQDKSEGKAGSGAAAAGGSAPENLKSAKARGFVKAKPQTKRDIMADPAAAAKLTLREKMVFTQRIIGSPCDRAQAAVVRESRVSQCESRASRRNRVIFCVSCDVAAVAAPGSRSDRGRAALRDEKRMTAAASTVV